MILNVFQYKKKDFRYNVTNILLQFYNYNTNAHFHPMDHYTSYNVNNSLLTIAYYKNHSHTDRYIKQKND